MNDQKRFLVRRRSGIIYERECSASSVLLAVDTAERHLSSWGGYSAGEPLPPHALDDVAAAYAALDEIRRIFPQVTCWCVVKHYGSDGLHARPAVWCGLRYRERAEAFRTAIEAHYEKQRKPWWKPDTWTVEQRGCDITSVLHDELTPEDYVKGLAT